MKKTGFLILSILLIAGVIMLKAASSAQSTFTQAIKTCETFSMDGEATNGGEVFNLTITLSKTKDDGCIYKEKISQGKNYELLTCRFEKGYLPYIASSMERYNKYYAKQIAKNSIFSAKLTSNGEVLNKYLVNPKICQITTSK